MKLELNKQGQELVDKVKIMYDLMDYFGLVFDRIYEVESENFNLANILRDIIAEEYSKEDFMEEFKYTEREFEDLKPYLKQN